MNNQSDKPEKFEPKDSKQKKVKHPEDDNEAVLKSEDKIYKGENVNFKNVAGKRERSEQPVYSVKK